MEMRKWEFWSQLFSWAHPVISLQNEEAGTMLSIFFFLYLFTWLCWVFVMALGISDLCCSMQDL